MIIIKTLYVKEINSIVGKLTIICDNNFIIRLLFENDNFNEVIKKLEKIYGNLDLQKTCPLAETCEGELEAYFKGKLKVFTVKPLFMGTNYQILIWNTLIKIPYGSVVSYAKLAELSGVSGARVAGNAVGLNPVPIILFPCQRVIRSSGQLGGFSGGIDRKLLLLKNEGLFLDNVEKT